MLRVPESRSAGLGVAPGPAAPKRLASLLILLSVPFLLAQTSTSEESSRPVVDAVGNVSLSVSDLDRSVAYFSDVLTFERDGDISLREDPAEGLDGAAKLELRVATMKLGQERIELAQPVSRPGRGLPADTRANDLSFQHIAIIVSDMDRAYARLMAHGVRPASKGGPQTLPDWNKNAGGIKAFYFRDPDGHFLEILQFPPDKGPSKWHRAISGATEPGGDARLFLGIDHTAIVVSSTEASLKFYRDRLGLNVAGGSENYGPEQEALNNVPGARLRITTLRAARGPGIELLEYLQPRDGRPYPTGLRPEDVLYWRTRLTVSAPPMPHGTTHTLRDPDGHVIELVYDVAHERPENSP